MHGVVLWFDPSARVGMIWCEDQGPLAFLAPDIALPTGRAALDCGDQILFTVETIEGVRQVRDIYQVIDGIPGVDPAQLLEDFQQTQERAGHLSVVA